MDEAHDNHWMREALAEARQFEGFHRLSDFVLHDIKNLIAQLSLVARNAAKHRDNPAFIDDAIATIENAVLKMNRLMAQLQSADVTGQKRPLDLVTEVRDVVAAKAGGRPSPTLRAEVPTLRVSAEPDRLSAVIGHVIQNAQDATPPDGEVEVAGSGYEPSGELLFEGDPIAPAPETALGRALTAAALCNDAKLAAPGSGDEDWGVVGDPTEGALLALASKAGF